VSLDRRRALLLAPLVLGLLAVGAAGYVRLRTTADPARRVPFGLRICGNKASIEDLQAFGQSWTAAEEPKPIDISSAASPLPLGTATIQLHGLMTRTSDDRASVRVSDQVTFRMRRGAGGPRCG
jgi:hypothetical protein